MRVCRDSFVFPALAGLATLWVVFQTLVRKKELFTGSEDEFLFAVNTSQGLIVVLIHWLASYGLVRKDHLHGR
jgi:hypothetical protein